MAITFGRVEVGTVGVICPVCETEMPVPVFAEMRDNDQAHEGRAMLDCLPDMADVWAHMWTHDV